MRGDVRPHAALFYVMAQMIGAIAGVWLAHLMFSLPIPQASVHARTSAGELVGEFVATFGLLALILSTSRHKPAAVPYGVAAYITGACWSTSSTSFANPAETFARSLSDSHAKREPGVSG